MKTFFEVKNEIEYTLLDDLLFPGTTASVEVNKESKTKLFPSQ